MSWRGHCKGWDEDSGRGPRGGLGEGAGGVGRECGCRDLCGAERWEDGGRSEGQVLRSLLL